jgi:hypothetical protein
MQDKNPVLAITSPEYLLTVPPKKQLVLAATGYDPKDGWLMASNLVFSSDLDGRFGDRFAFGYKNMNPGTHKITVCISTATGL